MGFPKGAAQIYSEEHLKGNLVTDESNPTTLAGVLQVLPYDPERTQLMMYNLSASEIYVGFSGNVSAANGMLIPPAGGFMSMNVTEDFETVCQGLHVYSAAAGNQLYITTTRRDTEI